MLFIAIMFMAVHAAYAYEYPAMSMTYDRDNEYRNDYDEVHPDNTRSGYFLNGQMSVHDNGKEDRRFRWYYAKPQTSTSPYTTINTLSRTPYDDEWTRSCWSVSKHAAMVGAWSQHSNKREDREWDFYCGLLDTSRYRLVDCAYTGFVNDYDEPIDYSCPNSGVIRSFYSIHDNGKEDRRWKFECCRIANVDYTFDEVIGSWFTIASCRSETECPITHSVTIGVEQTQVETVTQEYTESLETSISIGFGFEYAGSSTSMETTVTSGVSQTTATTLETALTYTQEETISVTCIADYVYIWRMEAAVTINDVPSGDMSITDVNYLCTDIPNPQCPLGSCVDLDCQVCSDNYNSQAAQSAHPIEWSNLLDHLDDEQMGNAFKYDMGYHIIGVLVGLATIIMLYIAFCYYRIRLLSRNTDRYPLILKS